MRSLVGKIKTLVVVNSCGIKQVVVVLREKIKVVQNVITVKRRLKKFGFIQGYLKAMGFILL